MSVEVRPLNVLCNIQCLYCYQHPQRDAANVKKTYDLVKIKNAVEAEGGPFVLFGGEPLLLPLQDLDNLWSWGFKNYGRNSVQTNGTLISAEHIEMFRKYNVSVGISVDGPGELNDVRWHGNLEKTRESTAKTHLAIEALCRAGITPALIITLHRGNAVPDKVPALLKWVGELHQQGVRIFRLHLLESENQRIREHLALSDEENIFALRAFLGLSRELPKLQFDLFRDMRKLLVGNDSSVSCTWKGCDSYTTQAVHGIEGQGHRSNCGRSNKDGIDFIKSSRVGFERYLALYHTPQQDGGCKDCRFFLMCKGQCPGTAIAGDWRNRTEHCEVWKACFELLEKELVEEGIAPLSLSGKRVEIEKQVVEAWSNQKDIPISQLVEVQLPSQTGGADAMKGTTR